MCTETEQYNVQYSPSLSVTASSAALLRQDLEAGASVWGRIEPGKAAGCAQRSTGVPGNDERGLDRTRREKGGKRRGRARVPGPPGSIG
jgi:hypothetical protein